MRPAPTRERAHEVHLVACSRFCCCWLPECRLPTRSTSERCPRPYNVVDSSFPSYLFYTHTHKPTKSSESQSRLSTLLYLLSHMKISPRVGRHSARCGYSRLGDRKRQIEFKFARRPAATQSVPASRSQIAFPPAESHDDANSNTSHSSSRPVRAAIAACHRVHFHIVKPDSRQGQILL